ncbi:hypothetical protein BS47DRAFT_1487841 [Hydnum rufescens UP504]|uniref:Uncharacterized protein n=1 Tax=Hydnum rufescens UP504 TaxID=1448309 RepID=A0A9P6AQ74_9AGAM|nr:hypothetical protein BS47DRAFT_1487841 [Hydnum rufescens UP504]
MYAVAAAEPTILWTNYNDRHPRHSSLSRSKSFVRRTLRSSFYSPYHLPCSPPPTSREAHALHGRDFPLDGPDTIERAVLRSTLPLGMHDSFVLNTIVPPPFVLATARYRGILGSDRKLLRNYWRDLDQAWVCLLPLYWVSMKTVLVADTAHVRLLWELVNCIALSGYELFRLVDLENVRARIAPILYVLGLRPIVEL